MSGRVSLERCPQPDPTLLNLSVFSISYVRLLRTLSIAVSCLVGLILDDYLIAMDPYLDRCCIPKSELRPDRLQMSASPEISSTIYKKLPHSEDSTFSRLIVLYPGSPNDDLRCYLEPWEVPMGSFKPSSMALYVALSYAWGDPTETESIWCNDIPSKITRNLAAALRSLRREESALVVWADAICVNQSDVSEKNAQVPVMAAIYKFAWVVVVWLGESSRDSQQAFGLLERLRNYDEHQPQSREALGLPPTVDRLKPIHPAVEALGKLTQRPWFQRTWILQEVACAVQVYIRCGKDHLSKDDFLFGLRWASELGLDPGFPDSAHLGAVTAFTLESMAQRESLLDILIQFRGNFATDPKDKIYAFY